MTNPNLTENEFTADLGLDLVSQASIRIADEGPDISPEHIHHMFERFYRSDEARDRGTGGAGLGLAICKRIVEAHGGRIEVESTPGERATFIVYSPLAGANPGLLRQIDAVLKQRGGET